MEKKQYIKPEMEVVELATDVIMTGGSFGLNDEEVDSEIEQLVIIKNPGRRGKWGDLWSVEEEPK